MFIDAESRGGAGRSVGANSTSPETGLPRASMSDAGGFLIEPSLMNVTTVRKTRITAAPTVQPISSRVLPWIWAATRPRRARKRNSDQIRIPSTPRKITIAIARMSL